jgi:phage tail sheath protein FI
MLAARLHDISAARPGSESIRLSGGRDGTAALRVADFIGAHASQERLGLRTLELVTDVNMVAIPDALVASEPAVRRDPPPQPNENPCCGTVSPPESTEPPMLIEALPTFAPDDVAAIQQAIIDHCEQERFRFALLDAPRDRRELAGDVDDVLAWRSRFSTRRGALYYPWLLVTDLSASGSTLDTVRAVPPSGHVAGVIAYTDLTFGAHAAPANVELSWAQGTTEQIDAELQGVLNPCGVNCLRTLPGRGLRVYGARTLSAEPQWIYVNVRRLMSYIEHSIDRSLQWAVFEPNDVLLRHTIAVAISGFLESLASRGALAAEEDGQGWFVRCDDTTTTRDDEDAGRLLAVVGVAPVKPAEFILLRIGRLEDRWEIAESGGR